MVVPVPLLEEPVHRLLSRSRSGTRTRVRRLGAGEGDLVRHVLEGMSERSRRLRFHGPVPVVTDALARQLARVDGDRVALVAERWTRDGWEPVGLGQLAPEAPGVLELAVAVVDAHQGQGLGRRLVAELVAAATDADHDRLVAYVMGENEAMLHVLREELPMARTRHDSSGVLRLEASLGPWTLSTDNVLGDLMRVA